MNNNLINPNKLTTFICNTFKCKNAKDINCGHCFWWAFTFFKLYGGQLFTVQDFGSHAFIKYNNKFYDSETPNGCLDWRKLKSYYWPPECNKTVMRTHPLNMAIPMSEYQFKKYWGIHNNDKSFVISMAKKYVY